MHESIRLAITAIVAGFMLWALSVYVRETTNSCNAKGGRLVRGLFLMECVVEAKPQ